MATGKKFYWIKVKDTFLASDTVDYLMEQKNGASYVLLYQILCLKTANTDGRLVRCIGDVTVPYDADKIARDAKWFSVPVVRAALKLYQSLGLMSTDEHGYLTIQNIKNMVGKSTDYAAQKASQRVDK